MNRCYIHHLLRTAIRLVFFAWPACFCLTLASCWLNTSGKLDAPGKYIEAYYINTSQPAAQIFEQSGRYYIKAPRLHLNPAPRMWTSVSEPSHYICMETKAWAYHEIFSYNKKSLPLPGQGNLPIPEPDAPWIPSGEFENSPFTVLGNAQSPTAPQPGTLLSSYELKAPSTHRSVGNILRLPLVGLSFCAIDLPAMFVTAIPYGICTNDWLSNDPLPSQMGRTQSHNCSDPECNFHSHDSFGNCE